MASIRKTDSGKWQARISIKGQAKSIGTFATKKEAQEKAAWYEKEIKPEVIKDDLLDMFEKEVLVWQTRLKDFQGENEVLEKVMIQLHLDKIDTTIRTYKREKDERDAKNINSISIS
jgi:hypothetical protein